MCRSRPRKQAQSRRETDGVRKKPVEGTDRGTKERTNRDSFYDAALVQGPQSVDPYRICFENAKGPVSKSRAATINIRQHQSLH